MSPRLLRLATAAALLLPAWCAAALPVQSFDRARIEALLAAETPCCVIDARSEAERGKLGIAHALVYREGMKIRPAGWVIVIADTEAHAVRVAESLAERNAARHVAAVRGGARTWLDAQQQLNAGPAGVLSFIIPSNTCEQGPALQTLPAGRR